MNGCCYFLYSLDWANIVVAGLAAFAGGWAAFYAAHVEEGKKNIANEKSKLIQYFYDLHFALRNISNYCDALEKYQGKEQGSHTAESMRNLIKFNFDPMFISFVCNRKPLLFENILQLTTSLDVLYEVSQSDDIPKVWQNIVITSVQLIATMENIDAYLTTYYNQPSLIVENVQKNINFVIGLCPGLQEFRETGKVPKDNKLVESYKEWIIDFKE